MATTLRAHAKPSVACLLLASLAYLALALWAMRGVLPDPSSLLLGVSQAKRLAPLDRADQQMVLGTVAGNASRIATRPWMLREEGQCYPLPRGYTLGEHMFGAGLLAALPLAVTGNPILSYNFLLVLTLWIPAMAMFVFSFGFVRSVPAAFLAGLVFAFARVRLVDPVHPYVHGDLWTPLALYFLYRLFSREDWPSALGLVTFGVLELGESLYALLSALLLLSVCGLFLALADFARLKRVLPKLAACGLVGAVAAWFVLAPYVATAKAWGVAQGRTSMFAFPVQFTPGYELFPGWILVVLGTMGLLDRLRGRRLGPGGDPRVAIAVAGFLTLWCSVFALGIPGTGLIVPSPLLLAQRYGVPGLDSVRALYGIRIGVNLALCFLAGYGVLALVERMRLGLQVTVVAILVLLVVAEVERPALATRSFGAPLPQEPYRAALSPGDAALVSAIQNGAVLDYPPMGPNILAQAHQLLLASYHRFPTAACYNSFASPVREDVTKLATELPAPEAAEALAALGFGTVIVHREFMPEAMKAEFDRNLVATGNAGGRLAATGETEAHRTYRLRSRGQIDDNVKQIASGRPEGEPAVAAPPSAALEFEFRNEGAATFRHPEPILPTPLVVRWLDAGGRVAAESDVRALLPLAVPPGGSAGREIILPVTVPPGRYTVTLSARADPTLVLAARPVEVRAADAPAPDVAGGASRQ